VNADDLLALWVTAKLATISTLVLLVVGTPLAWWLARTRRRLGVWVEAVVALPLVLPPTVLGFYLLIALGPNGPLGRLAVALGGAPLAFTFTGLVIGSVVYSLPFVVQPLEDAFGTVGERPLEVAATLRASPLDRFFTVAVPLARPGFLTATVLGFAHTVGEFGVVLMIGGNIPGVTRVLSVAIYDHVETLDYARAHALAAGLLVVSMLLLVGVYVINRRFGSRGGGPRGGGPSGGGPGREGPDQSGPAGASGARWGGGPR
jgi:molybdate transport system permease protein